MSAQVSTSSPCLTEWLAIGITVDCRRVGANVPWVDLTRSPSGRQMAGVCALPPSTVGARPGWNRAAVPAITNVDGQGTQPASGNSPKGVASRAASKASLSAVSDNANLIAGALAMRAINT